MFTIFISFTSYIDDILINHHNKKAYFMSENAQCKLFIFYVMLIDNYDLTFVLFPDPSLYHPKEL